MNLAKFSVYRPVTITMMILIVLVFGVLSFSRLDLDMLPDIDYPMVSVITSYTGATSKDVENVLTKPIESAVSTVEDVKSISSVSQEGLSLVMIEFNSGTNVDFAGQDVRDKLGLIEDVLPDEAGKPMVVKMDVGAMPIVAYGVTSKSLNTLDLKKVLTDNIQEKLERLDGVASVQLQGGQEREILVSLNKDKMDNFGISQSQIIQVLRAQNISLSGGFLESGRQELPLRTEGDFESISEIENIVIANFKNTPIYLKDVAIVKDTHKEVRGFSRTNGEEGVLMMINKQSGANTSRVAEEVKKTLPSLRQYLPDDINFSLVMDQSLMIKNSTDSVTQSGLIGALLAMLVVYLFLRNWRPTLAIGLAIPLSVIATFIPIYLVGYTLNLMTLAGLSLGIGMLVDNAVVVIENIYRHLEKSKKRKKSAIIGANEVALAITASTLTTIAVFLPMSFGSGVAGQLSRGLSLTIIFALSSSLFVAISLVPMIASKIFKKEKDEKKSKSSFFEKSRRYYEKLLAWSLKHRLKTVFFALFLFFLTLALTPFIGAEFMPKSDQHIMMVNLEMPLGSSLSETDKAVKPIEEALFKYAKNSLVSVTSFIGQDTSDAHAVSMGMSGGINKATIMIRLKEKNKRDLSGEDIKEIIRKNKPIIRGLKITYMDMSAMMMGGAPSPIEVKIFGKDLDKLKELSDDIAEKIKKVNGLRDVQSDFDLGKPQLSIKIDKEKASYFGLTVADVSSQIKGAMQGVVATKFRQEGEETDIRVRYDEEYRNNLEKVLNLNIHSPRGAVISLGQVAQIKQSRGPVQIKREDHLRVITLSADVANRNIGKATDDVKKVLENYNFPTGYFVEFGGAQKQMQETFGTMAFALLVGILLVYMVMAAQFESFVYPFVVMFEIPLAFIGVGLGLFLTRQSLSLPSFMGLIMLSGIVVNNAIVLIDYVNQLRKKGLSKFDALLVGGSNRLRPILITSITTILGMLPMALTRHEGSEIMRPMAIAVIGGLLASTFLTLIIIPVAYSLIDGLSKRIYLKLKNFLI